MSRIKSMSARFMKMSFLSIMFLLVLCSDVLIASDVVTEQNLRDAILERKTFTQQELQELDINKDNKVDISDLIFYLRNGSPPSIIGEHVGILYRDNGKMIEGQSDVMGQTPFVLNITSASPLQGVLDNTSGDVNKAYSLYFPNQSIPITFLDGIQQFKLTFKTLSSNLAPNIELKRTMTFTGVFFKSDKRVLTGTYTEDISGFKDNRGNDIPIILTGKFKLVL